ncbi:unnamed protein product [Malus baccata var. baccata]
MAVGDPRTKTVQIVCGNQRERNTTMFVPNFVSTMDYISEQMPTSGFGVAVTGSGPDTNYGLAQYYGDLSLLDSVLCYNEAYTVLPQCFPYNGGRIFLDGCFMRSKNYSFYEEFRGSEDRVECGNTTRKSSAFGEAARQVVKHAVESAPSNRGYARGEVSVSGAANESAYCLENASASMLGCLPWSEGRALYTGCFMRYSDKDFLNKEMGNGSSRGTTIVIVVSVVSSLVVLVVGVAIGFYSWKHRYIQKKRRGKKLLEILQCYQITWKHFQAGTVDELYDPNLMLQNCHDNVKDEIFRVVQIGLLCTQESSSLRPTMSKALQMLTKKELHLPAPINPPFIDEKTMELNDNGDDQCYPLNAGLASTNFSYEGAEESQAATWPCSYQSENTSNDKVKFE